MITPLIFVCMDAVTGSTKCLLNFNKQTLQLNFSCIAFLTLNVMKILLIDVFFKCRRRTTGVIY
jgi:hypothetical protein